MKMKQRITALALGLLLSTLAGPAFAAVQTIGTANYATGGGAGTHLLYDSAVSTSIVWLDYSHAPAAWSDQNTWASGLSGTTSLNPGFTLTGTGWRLPTVAEMLQLYTIEQPSYSGFTANTVNNLADSNQGWNWTSSVDGPSGNNGNNYAVNMNSWNTGHADNGTLVSAIAVHDLVPEPSTYLLLCLSLGVVWYARKRLTAC